MITERANSARLLVPQLKYFYAGDIPTYALSNAYEPDSLDANRDIFPRSRADLDQILKSFVVDTK